MCRIENHMVVGSPFPPERTDVTMCDFCHNYETDDEIEIVGAGSYICYDCRMKFTCQVCGEYPEDGVLWIDEHDGDKVCSACKALEPDSTYVRYFLPDPE